MIPDEVKLVAMNCS